MTSSQYMYIHMYVAAFCLTTVYWESFEVVVFADYLTTYLATRKVL